LRIPIPSAKIGNRYPERVEIVMIETKPIRVPKSMFDWIVLLVIIPFIIVSMTAVMITVAGKMKSASGTANKSGLAPYSDEASLNKTDNQAASPGENSETDAVGSATNKTTETKAATPDVISKATSKPTAQSGSVDTVSSATQTGTKPTGTTGTVDTVASATQTGTEPTGTTGTVDTVASATQTGTKPTGTTGTVDTVASATQTNNDEDADDDDDGEDEDQYSVSGQIISAAKARSIAITRVGEAAVIRKIELDYEDYPPVYSIELVLGNEQYQLEIHAVTSAILEFRHEYLEDDD
jgi:uncharacterized membrane protein YkoI